MKLFRYRRRSLSTTVGLTKLKKRSNKALGITALMKPFRAQKNFERKLKRKAGYYSEPAKALRYASQHTSHKKTSTKKSPAMTEMKTVRINYGFFGKPNYRGIGKAIGKYTSEGYNLTEHSEKKGGLFSRSHTLLIFMK